METRVLVSVLCLVLAPAPATAAVSRVLVSPQLEQEEEEDTGFPGVATLTQLPRFRIQSDEAETEEEEDIVSSEAFRNAVFHFAALQRNCRDLHLTLLNRDTHLSICLGYRCTCTLGHRKLLSNTYSISTVYSTLYSEGGRFYIASQF